MFSADVGYTRVSKVIQVEQTTAQASYNQTDTFVPSASRATLAQADADAFDGLGISHHPCETGWREADGSPLAEDGSSKRAFALHTDTHHPASSRYNFSTPASIERQSRRRWKEGVTFTYRAFTTPPHVSLKAVERCASRFECGPDLSPYGGLRLVTAVALTLVWDVSDETVWGDEQFRREFRQEVGEPAQVSPSKALRKLFELRGDGE